MDELILQLEIKCLNLFSFSGLGFVGLCQYSNEIQQKKTPLTLKPVPWFRKQKAKFGLMSEQFLGILT